MQPTARQCEEERLKTSMEIGKVMKTFNRITVSACVIKSEATTGNAATSSLSNARRRRRNRSIQLKENGRDLPCEV